MSRRPSPRPPPHRRPPNPHRASPRPLTHAETALFLATQGAILPDLDAVEYIEGLTLGGVEMGRDLEQVTYQKSSLISSQTT
ncbi:hypothetical protein Dxin01_03065 [Deinococcus xinjiangensis]|uniref:Uncharacterized protein n=1 Tax=Deinococcus xinjiangensis TaxID=457454 RepID=A0ABP9VDJ7_9DEIO